MLHVLWFHSDKFGCGVYRSYIPALSLEDQAFAVSDFILHRDVGYQVPEMMLDGCDVAVFQRTAGSVFVDSMKWCKQHGVSIVYEMDDDLFHIPKSNPARPLWELKKIQKSLRTQLEMADVITVSTRPLAETVALELHVPVESIHVCMNHLHRSVWENWLTDPVFRGDTGPVIGWQGSATHEVDFASILPALQRILQEFPDVNCRFLGTVPFCVKDAIPPNRFTFTNGVPFEKYPSLLKFANFTIGIAPIVDSKFNRCKSNIKWLEYSAVGVPCVASRVYPYERSIENGVTGLLAGSVEEWYTALKSLLEFPGLRRSMAQKANEVVWDQWGPTRVHSWVNAFSIAHPELRRSAGTGDSPTHRTE